MNSHKSQFTTTQRWTLLSTILASSLVFIDSTALNVALPALQEDLGLSATALLWVVNGYALFLSALLLVGGALGDVYGRNKTFLIGLGVFSISSLLCGMSDSSVQLVIARCIQGIGGALLTPGSLSILSAQFEKESRGRAIGLWSTFSALTAVFGPVLGGWLAGMGLWRVIFFLNVPLSIVVFISMIAKIPESKNPNRGKLDLYGAICITLALTGLTYGFIESSNYGFGHPVILSTLIGGVGTLAIFLLIEQRSSYPMMPLGLFSSSTFSGANVLTLFVYGALGGATFFIPLNLIQIQGYSEVETGLSMLPIILLIASISMLMGSYVDRKGARLPLTIGPFIAGLGFLLFTAFGITAGIEQYWSTFFIAFILMGVGMGITVAPLTTAVMGAVPDDSSGIASGINNTVSRAAGVLAVALMGAMVLFSFRAYIDCGIGEIGVSKAVQYEIAAEVTKLAAAKAPEGLPPGKAVKINQLLKNAFVHAFNKAVSVAAFLMFLGGVVAFFTVRDHIEPKDDRLVGDFDTKSR